jgi:hypothetical protein
VTNDAPVARVHCRGKREPPPGQRLPSLAVKAAYIGAREPAAVGRRASQHSGSSHRAPRVWPVRVSVCAICPFSASLVGQGRRDSNPEPPVLETGALPIELRPFAGASVPAAGCGLSYTHAVARRRRPALGALFLLIGLGFAAIAYAAAVAGDAAWIVAGAAALLAVWMGELAFRALR